jgi:hypothetical protein
MFINVSCISATVGLAFASSEELPSYGWNIVSTTFCSRTTNKLMKGTTSSGAEVFAITLQRGGGKGRPKLGDNAILKRRGEREREWNPRMWIYTGRMEPVKTHLPLVPARCGDTAYPEFAKNHAQNEPVLSLHIPETVDDAMLATRTKI